LVGFVGLEIIAGLSGLFGGLLLLFGLILLYGFYKLLKMSKTGWTIVVVLEILSLILSILTFNLIGIILAIFNNSWLFGSKKGFI